MVQLEQRIDYLEESNELLRMQNRVLATAFKALIQSLPSDMAGDAVEAVRAAFDDEVAQLEYEDNPNVELFHDITYDFFRERR